MGRDAILQERVLGEDVRLGRDESVITLDSTAREPGQLPKEIPSYSQGATDDA